MFLKNVMSIWAVGIPGKWREVGGEMAGKRRKRRKGRRRGGKRKR